MAKDTEVSMTVIERVVHEIKELASVVVIFAPIWLLFNTFFFELRSIPSESMVPNLLVSDRVAVSKFSYGFSKHSVPFGLGRMLNLPDGRLFGGTPERGDVIVFQHPHKKRVMIKRLIGVPGDKIKVVNNKIFLNDSPVAQVAAQRVVYRDARYNRQVIADEYMETLPDGPVYKVHKMQGRPGKSSFTFVVPEGHYFFMGDNRDNSADSREPAGHCPHNSDGVISEVGCEPLYDGRGDTTIGFVPYDNLIGKAETVLFTFNFCQKFENGCPEGRVWKSL